MASATLVKPSIDNESKRISLGKDLILELDETEFEVKSAFWLYLSEIKEWRLFLGSDFEPRFGPRKSYEFLNKILIEKKIDIPLQNISVVSPRSSLILNMRVIITTDRSINGITIKDCNINDFSIDEAFIYRMM